MLAKVDMQFYWKHRFLWLHNLYAVECTEMTFISVYIAYFLVLRRELMVYGVNAFRVIKNLNYILR